MPKTPDDVFNAMPGAFKPEKAGSVEMNLQFDLSGDTGGKWVVEIVSGECKTRSGTTSSPVAKIQTSDTDFMALFNKNLNAVAAYMSGRVRVDGDVIAIMNLLSFFELP
ncbi:MAG: SCP2 sterol-binding domain-containing protein [Anaerolineales bacterium]|nr:SCP2 sterol-binding domain-containing protein [Anaerolineales bacterium]